MENGTNVDVRTFRGRTPLHIASEMGLVEIVKFLLENGADVNAKDIWGNKPIDLTSHEKTKELLSGEKNEKNS